MNRFGKDLCMAYFTPYIDSSGIHLPTYEDRLQDLCSAYRSIFGQEAGLSPAVSAQISAYIREISPSFVITSVS